MTTKQEINSLFRVRTAIKIIKELFLFEETKSTQKRKKQMESIHQSLALHAIRLGVKSEALRLSHWYLPKQYLDHALLVEAFVKETYPEGE